MSGAGVSTSLRKFYMSDSKTVPVTILQLRSSKAATFNLPVVITKLDGTKGNISVPCKALRKTEWASLRDDRQREALQAALQPAAVDDVAISDPADRAAAVVDAVATRGHEATVRSGAKRDAETIMSFVSEEGAEQGYSTQSLVDLEDDFGGSLGAILQAYDLAIYQGRLGNL